MSTRPVPASWAIAATSPSWFQLIPASSLSVTAIGDAAGGSDGSRSRMADGAYPSPDAPPPTFAVPECPIRMVATDPFPGGGPPRPPVAPRRPTELRHHGDVRVDDWYWLRDRDDPAVRAYLEAENAYTEGALEPLTTQREKIFEEIRGRVREND